MSLIYNNNIVAENNNIYYVQLNTRDFAAGDTSIEVKLPKTFKNTDYGVFPKVQNHISGFASIFCAVKSKTTSSFTLTVYNEQPTTTVKNITIGILIIENN